MEDKIRGITKRIRLMLERYPLAKPKILSKTLYESLNETQKKLFTLKTFYNKYQGLINTEKWAYTKWRKNEIYGRPHIDVETHRVEYTLEKPLGQVFVEAIGVVAEKYRPGVRDKKPVGLWYVIPNRNRCRVFFDDVLSVRVFPQSGTVRVLAATDMPYLQLVYGLERALFLGGVDLRDAELLARTLVTHDRHKTFRVGPLTPFKVDHYRDSLGLTVGADGSHPFHLETKEEWPAWVRPLIESNVSTAQSNERIAENLRLFSENIKLHLSTLEGIRDSVDEFKKVVVELAKLLYLKKSD